jgi:sugar lactone lactonase YvrE
MLWENMEERGMRGISAIAALMLGCAAAPALAQPMQLPAEIAYPEGIAADSAGNLYVAGTRDGTIARIGKDGSAQTLPTGLATQIADQFPGVLGLEVDGKGRLWMAGGRTRKIFVADAGTGKLLAAIDAGTEGQGLINDLEIVGGTAYFTDTLSPRMWAVKLTDPLPARAEAWIDFGGTALVHGEGANLNGVTATPDGKTLIVGQMGKGLLFTIDIATKKVTPIDLKGELVQGADGLVLKGDTLYVVRQPAAEIVTVKLAKDLTSGTVVKRTQSPGLAWPATAVVQSDALLLVNSQFNKRQDDGATRPFTLLRVPLKDLE